jgi:hypothetical protein
MWLCVVIRDNIHVPVLHVFEVGKLCENSSCHEISPVKKGGLFLTLLDARKPFSLRWRLDTEATMFAVVAVKKGWYDASDHGSFIAIVLTVQVFQNVTPRCWLKAPATLSGGSRFDVAVMLQFALIFGRIFALQPKPATTLREGMRLASTDGKTNLSVIGQSFEIETEAQIHGLRGNWRLLLSELNLRAVSISTPWLLIKLAPLKLFVALVPRSRKPNKGITTNLYLECQVLWICLVCSPRDNAKLGARLQAWASSSFKW